MRPGSRQRLQEFGAHTGTSNRRSQPPTRHAPRDTYKERGTRIDTEQAKPATAGMPAGGTVYLTAADETWRMGDAVAVSMIQSNYMGFGSGVIVPGPGLVTEPGPRSSSRRRANPHQVGPNKRPYHKIIPGFMTRCTTSRCRATSEPRPTNRNSVPPSFAAQIGGDVVSTPQDLSRHTPR